MNQYKYNYIKNNLSEDSIKKLADVNGDGTVSNLDLIIIKQYLDGEILELPGHLNGLSSETERINWVMKMFTIDKTDEHLYIMEDRTWVCFHFSFQN